MDSVGINLAVCMGQIGFRIIIGRRAAILGKAHTGVPGQIEFVIQNGPFPAHKQQRLVIGKQAHFIGGHQVAACLLVVDAVAAVAAFGLAVGIRVQRFLAQQFRNVFVGFLLVAAEVQQRVAVAHKAFPAVLEQRLELGHVLDHNGHRDFPAAHGGKDLVEVIGQGDVGELVHDAMHMDRQPPAAFPVRHIVQRLEQLGVDHAHKVIQRGVGIRDAAEQGDLPFPDGGQIQLVRAGQLGDLGQVERRQPDPHTDQNGFGGFARNELSRTF